MKNKTIVYFLISAMAALFVSGFLSVFPGQEGLVALLSLYGYPVYFVFLIWAMVRLYKIKD